MILALLVATAAGLATTIGGFLAVGRRGLQRSWVAVTLAFAAGAMLFVSLVELLPLGIAAMEGYLERRTALLVGFASFFAGMVLVLAINRLVNDAFKPAEVEGPEGEVAHAPCSSARLARSGFLVAVVLALHNFPEGMATFFTTYNDPRLGLSLAVAIALHNIPEGIAVAAPVYAATGSRRRAVGWATASGLTEPLGALVAALLMTWLQPGGLFGVLSSLVAGMMVFLALDELLPGSWHYHTKRHQTVYGMLVGMAVVALSLVLIT